MMHIYVHIPFCDSICYYCDFKRGLYEKAVLKLWLKQIEKEVNALDLRSISTLYFGGGTPSCLPLDLFSQLASLFTPYLCKDYEWTVECNPNNINEALINTYLQAGVNRISLGVQSFDDTFLQAIGRKHSSQDVFNSIQRFREAGLNNLSVDLIYGLPNQTLADVKNEIRTFLSLNVPHLSIYALQIEPGSIFGKKGLKPCEEGLDANMYECIRQMMTEHGYEHYEISSYARNGMYSRHNRCYWDDSDFIGIGWGASGKEGSRRYDHVDTLSNYLQDERRVYVEDCDAPFESIMMSLRTCFGLDCQKWERKYHQDFKKVYDKQLQTYVPEYLYWKDHHLICTEKGLEILNTILVDFLPDD